MSYKKCLLGDALEVKSGLGFALVERMKQEAVMFSLAQAMDLAQTNWTFFQMKTVAL